MHSTQRVPVADSGGRVTYSTNADPTSGWHNPSNGVWDFYSSATKALGFGMTSSDPSITGYSQELRLLTDTDTKPVIINTKNMTATSGDVMAFSVKPAGTVTSTGTLFGGQISPRINDDIDYANIIGLHIDAYLKGTATKTISSDVRALNLELVTDDGGTNTVSGNVTGIRIRAAFSATTLTGVMAPIRIEKAESQTNSQQWDCVLELPGTNAGIWNNNPTTENDGALEGYIKVLIGGVAKYIRLYAVGNQAD